MAAAVAVGYDSIGIEKDSQYFGIAEKSVVALSQLKIDD